MEDITAVDYSHSKKVYKDFRINFGDRHDLRYVIVSWCTWKSSKYMTYMSICPIWHRCLKIYYLNPTHLVKVKVEVDLLTDMDMLLMMEKDIRGGICHVTYWYVKANNKYMKDYDKKKSSCVKCWDVNNLHG